MVSSPSLLSTTTEEQSSIHGRNVNEIHMVPFQVITRPIPPVLDDKKVCSLISAISDEENVKNVPPLDVLWITGSEGGQYYFSFGGCHRYEAYKRIGAKEIPCKLIRSTINDLRTYLGSSTPQLK
ncbi:putative sulfiredoxin [Hypsibius exemplaris]|uniref:Sulfiredoxin n=1 Tax=Hypsibius exemplaris TaxID=2072580 RepID=A0A1W0WHP5_HYPEX|nr:putative sulfiredoxin [Hypsibius exemplaris]